MRRSVLSKSKIEYTDYYLNCYEGCYHNCQYPCYARLIKRKGVIEWGIPKPILNAPELLRADISRLSEIPKDIMISTSTDAYQPLETTYRLTRKCIEILIAKELPFTILTKSSTVLQDLDLFKGYPKCKVGFTIITLYEEVKKEWEPLSSPIYERIEALRILKENGVKTWLSVEPILPNMDQSNPFAIVQALHTYVDEFVFGRLNYGKGTDPLYYRDMVQPLRTLCWSLQVKSYFKKEMSWIV